MRVWLVAISSGHGLSATAHATLEAATRYLKYQYGVPHVEDILAWLEENTDDEVLVDYDEITEPEPVAAGYRYGAAWDHWGGG